MANKILGVDNGSFSADTRIFAKQIRQTYIVLAQDINQDEDDILATTGIPTRLSPLRGALCIERHPKEVTRVIHPVTGVAAALWEVECQWDNTVSSEEATQILGGGSGSDPDNADPLERLPVVEWDGEMEEERLDEDKRTLRAITTPTLEPINLTTLVTTPILEITRYEAWPFDPDIMLSYAGHTNTKDFWGAPRGCALMLPMRVAQEVVKLERLNKVTYRIKFKLRKHPVEGTFREDGWAARPLLEGYKYFEQPNDGRPLIYIDKHGNPATVNLKLDGTINQGNPIFEEFFRFTEVDFDNLSLGPFF
jgi:hypothetical protein